MAIIYSFHLAANSGKVQIKQLYLVKNLCVNISEDIDLLQKQGA